MLLETAEAAATLIKQSVNGLCKVIAISSCTSSTMPTRACPVLSSNCAEASSVSKLLKSLGDGHTVQLDVAQDDKPSSAGSMLQATSDVISANPDVTVKVLDHSALKVGALHSIGSVPSMQ